MLGCTVEQIAAVSRLRGPFDLPDALEGSIAVIPIMVPSVAVGPNVAAPPGNAWRQVDPWGAPLDSTVR